LFGVAGSLDRVKLSDSVHVLFSAARSSFLRPEIDRTLRIEHVVCQTLPCLKALKRMDIYPIVR
jgi:hypothetical protein